MIVAPIVLFTYNRPRHLKQTVETLQKNLYADRSELFIFSDGPKNEKDEIKVKEVREYIKTIKGFKTIEIIERDRNWGLANNIIDGVTKIVNDYGKIIVLEDDLDTSPGFLKFINEGLELYEDEYKVASIHGYVYPLSNPEKLPETFFIRGADCWGWGTWARAWKYFEPDGKKLLEEMKKRKLTREFDFNNSYPYTKMLKDQIKGKNNSWAVRWYASAFLNDMFTLYPRKSLVMHIGFGGTHYGSDNILDVEIVGQINVVKIPVEECLEARAQFEDFLKKNFAFRNRIWNKLKRLFL
ncbi:glycosyltransferase [Caldisericum exile]|uniref:glycosyltransferase n=1 Tax=Caldisericum exile TaxID=693075 RepID=UPI003C756BE2